MTIPALMLMCGKEAVSEIETQAAAHRYSVVQKVFAKICYNFQNNRTFDVPKPLYIVKGGFESVYRLRRTI